MFSDSQVRQSFVGDRGLGVRKLLKLIVKDLKMYLVKNYWKLVQWKHRESKNYFLTARNLPNIMLKPEVLNSWNEKVQQQRWEINTVEMLE